eukprot:SAG11_NODE_10096_length_855_cov_1.427249_2_plen_87_part_00
MGCEGKALRVPQLRPAVQRLGCTARENSVWWLEPAQGMMADEKRKTMLLKAKLQEKHEHLEITARNLREKEDSGAPRYPLTSQVQR